jgi:hypothetical protein
MNRLDNSHAMAYIKSLKDAVKRQFAIAYLEWVRAGRRGAMPARGRLSPVLAVAVARNIDDRS